jgi:hypothetical protein
MTANGSEALAEALRERRRLIADREFYARDQAGHLRQLSDVSARIVELSSALPNPVDPGLAHFLQRCSYDKALVWLEEHAAADPISNRASAPAS